MSDPRDTTPQPPPVCCDPSAPVVTCCVCGAAVHTCERTEPVDNDYRCPAHVNGVEMSAGEWVCSDACGYERILAANWKRIAALEAQLAEAQERLAMAVDALSMLRRAWDELGPKYHSPLAPEHEEEARAVAGCMSKVEAATAEAVAHHTASVERRGAAKELKAITAEQQMVLDQDGELCYMVPSHRLLARAAELEGA